MRRNPHGPGDWCFGLTLARRFRRDPLAFATDLGRTYGDLCYFRMGPMRVYFVNSPPLIREVLSTKSKSFRRPELLVGPLRKIDGQGLVISDGELWQRQRRLVKPAFSPRRFDGYAAAIVESTARMLDRWQGASTLDVADEMTRLTLDIIAKTLFGVELGDRAARLGEAVRVISETFVAEAGNPFQLPDWLPLPAKRRKRWAIRTLDDLVRGVIRDRRARGDDRGDLLSMLLLAVDDEGDGTGMTDEQARDEAMTLFNAGHDTTAAALAWVWYAVASHPQVAARLADEADTVLGSRPATLADVPRLTYTEQVIKESMRLYPPTWILFAREVVTEIELGGYQVPRGSWLYTFPWVTHRDPRFFDDPLVFDPERFAPGREDKIPPFAYFPFGGGPRACIGSAFATMEMTLIVASVARRFRIELAPHQAPVEPEPLISLRPKGGLRVAISRRAQPACAAGAT